jgi:hypothetical protein
MRVNTGGHYSQQRNGYDPKCDLKIFFKYYLHGEYKF